MARPNLAVATPSVTKRPGGLLAVADVLDGGPRSALGVAFPSEGVCGIASATPDQCLLDYGNQGTSPKTWDGFDDIESVPLGIYKGIECWLNGDDDYTATATKALDIAGPARLETLFQALVLDPHSTTLNSTSTTYPIEVALAAVEHHLALSYGGVGIVHVPMGGLNWLADKNLIVRNLDGTFETLNGNRVANGAGYWPDFETLAYFPIWASPMVRLWHTPVEVNSGQKRTLNTQVAIAEQTWNAALDCYDVFKAFVDTGYETP